MIIDILIYQTKKKPNHKKDGIGGSYRLASLDRLASRQRILEQNGGYGALSGNNNGTAAAPTTNADKKNGLHKVDGVTNGSSSITHSVRQLCPLVHRDTNNNNNTFMNSEHTHEHMEWKEKHSLTYIWTDRSIEPTIVHPLTWPTRNVVKQFNQTRVPFNFLETIYTIVFDIAILTVIWYYYRIA